MEVINWIFWVIGAVVFVCAIALGTSFVVDYCVYHWRMVQPSQRAKKIESNVATVHRWFSGFKDLDIIWDFVYGETTDISQVRDAYAKARNASVYGEPIQTDSPNIPSVPRHSS